MFFHKVLGIIRRGRGGGCCGYKALSCMCRRGGEKPCAARRGASHLVTFATIWRVSGRRSDTTLLSFLLRIQGQCLHAWRLCCARCPGSFCGKPLVRLDLGRVVGFGRAFCCGRDGLLICWYLCQTRPGLDPGDADARGAGSCTGTTSRLLVGFASLLNDPSIQQGRMARRRGSSGGV